MKTPTVLSATPFTIHSIRQFKKLTQTSICSFLAFSTILSAAFAQCNPDASTSRAAGIPASVQTAINTFNGSLAGPLVIGNLSLAFALGVKPQISISEQDCKDNNDCGCGTYGTGTGSPNFLFSASATLAESSFGPMNSSVWDYTLTVSGAASGSVSGGAKNPGSLTVSRGCTDSEWSYSGSGQYTAGVTLSGAANGTAEVVEQNDQGESVVVWSGDASGTLGGTISLDIASSGNMNGSNGNVTLNSYSASMNFSFPIFGSARFSYSL